MRPEAARFARAGADLLRLAGLLARSTKGAFPAGPAAIALALATAYAEAAKGAFHALAEAQGASIGTEERARLLAAASLFRKAAGTIATKLPGPRGAAAVPSLAALSRGASLAAYVAAAFPDAPLVLVSPPGLDAVDALRRDPLVLMREAPEAILALMAAAADGVSFPSAAG